MQNMSGMAGFGRPGSRGGAATRGRRAGPVAGIDRGFMAQTDPDRGKHRKTVDASLIYSTLLEQRPFVRDYRDEIHLQPHSLSVQQVLPAPAYEDDVPGTYLARHWHTSVPQDRAPVKCAGFTPDGKRLITGLAGELTVWMGNTGNFDTVVGNVHEWAIQCMAWTHNGHYMLVGDEGGMIVYWTPNVSKESKWQAHDEKVGVNDISVSPTDRKFATAGEDGGVRIFDFWSQELEVAFPGHTSACKAVDWHPQRGLIASGGQDNMVRLWDPRARDGREQRVIAGHTAWVYDVEWNKNGWWLATGSRDNTIRLHDVRYDKEPFQTWTIDSKGVSTVSWHPHAESVLVSGSVAGSIHWWCAGYSYPQIAIPRAHDFSVNQIAWHTSGAIMVSCSDDHTTKFWERSRPGDTALQFAYQGNDRKGLPMDTADNLVHLPSTHGVGGALGVEGGRTFHELTGEGPDDGRIGAGPQRASKWGGGGGGDDGTTRPRSAVPPSGFICRICNIPGHWIQDCPNKVERGPRRDDSGGPGARVAPGDAPRAPPGPGYVCKICSTAGHWIQDCPNKVDSRPGPGPGPGVGPGGMGGGGGMGDGPGLAPRDAGRAPPGPGYICKICGTPGHWIQDCPSKPPPKGGPMGGGMGGMGMGGGPVVGPDGKKIPPPSYLCRICNIPGHWIQDCPVKATQSGGGGGGGGGGPRPSSQGPPGGPGMGMGMGGGQYEGGGGGGDVGMHGGPGPSGGMDVGYPPYPGPGGPAHGGMGGGAGPGPEGYPGGPMGALHHGGYDQGQGQGGYDGYGPGVGVAAGAGAGAGYMGGPQGGPAGYDGGYGGPGGAVPLGYGGGYDQQQQQGQGQGQYQGGSYGQEGQYGQHQGGGYGDAPQGYGQGQGQGHMQGYGAGAGAGDQYQGGAAGYGAPGAGYGGGQQDAYMQGGGGAGYGSQAQGYGGHGQGQGQGGYGGYAAGPY